MHFFRKSEQKSSPEFQSPDAERRVENEEEIITSISGSCRKWQVLRQKDLKEAVRRQIILNLEYGNKRVELDIVYANEALSAVVYIDNNDSPEEKRPNETTLLNQAVRMILEEIAQKSEMAINCAFKTRVASLKSWAASEEKGKKVYGWGDPVFDEKSKLYISEKTFYPSAADNQSHEKSK